MRSFEADNDGDEVIADMEVQGGGNAVVRHFLIPHVRWESPPHNQTQLKWWKYKIYQPRLMVTTGEWIRGKESHGGDGERWGFRIHPDESRNENKHGVLVARKCGLEVEIWEEKLRAVLQRGDKDEGGEGEGEMVEVLLKQMRDLILITAAGLEEVEARSSKHKP